MIIVEKNHEASGAARLARVCGGSFALMRALRRLVDAAFRALALRPFGALTLERRTRGAHYPIGLAQNLNAAPPAAHGQGAGLKHARARRDQRRVEAIRRVFLEEQ